jgi:hypothetical protein
MFKLILAILNCVNSFKTKPCMPIKTLQPLGFANYYVEQRKIECIFLLCRLLLCRLLGIYCVSCPIKMRK